MKNRLLFAGLNLNTIIQKKVQKKHLYWPMKVVSYELGSYERVCYELVCCERGLFSNVVRYKRGLLWTWSVMNGSVMNGSVMNMICYEGGLLWTGQLWTGLLWTWSVMNAVCYELVCYEQVCYERGLFWVVWYERVCFERAPKLLHNSNLLQISFSAMPVLCSRGFSDQ